MSDTRWTLLFPTHQEYVHDTKVVEASSVGKTLPKGCVGILPYPTIINDDPGANNTSRALDSNWLALDMDGIPRMEDGKEIKDAQTAEDIIDTAHSIFPGCEFYIKPSRHGTWLEPTMKCHLIVRTKQSISIHDRNAYTKAATNLFKGADRKFGGRYCLSDKDLEMYHSGNTGEFDLTTLQAPTPRTKKPYTPSQTHTPAESAAGLVQNAQLIVEMGRNELPSGFTLALASPNKPFIRMVSKHEVNSPGTWWGLPCGTIGHHGYPGEKINVWDKPVYLELSELGQKFYDQFGEVQSLLQDIWSRSGCKHWKAGNRIEKLNPGAKTASNYQMLKVGMEFLDRGMKFSRVLYHILWAIGVRRLRTKCRGITTTLFITSCGRRFHTLNALLAHLKQSNKTTSKVLAIHSLLSYIRRTGTWRQRTTNITSLLSYSLKRVCRAATQIQSLNPPNPLTSLSPNNPQAP